MNKRIKAVEITFENIDWIIIPAGYFEKIQLDDICDEFWFHDKNCTSMRMVAKRVMFELKKEADWHANTFDNDMYGIDTEEETLFERLQRQDITRIELLFAERASELYDVVWDDEDDDEYQNRNQSACLNENGNLHVVINAEDMEKSE